MSKKLFFNMVLLLISISINAQTTIKGKVFDGAMNNEPMIGASVQVPGTSVGGVTNLMVLSHSHCHRESLSFRFRWSDIRPK